MIDRIIAQHAHIHAREAPIGDFLGFFFIKRLSWLGKTSGRDSSYSLIQTFKVIPRTEKAFQILILLECVWIGEDSLKIQCSLEFAL